MPVPAVPEGLSKGVIDGTTIPWEVTTALKIPELVENHTEFEGVALYTLTFVLAMNKDKYESLTPYASRLRLTKTQVLSFQSSLVVHRLMQMVHHVKSRLITATTSSH